MVATYRHWLPLITRCPVNGLPDVGYVSVKTNIQIEIFALRKIIFSYSWKKIFMEDLTLEIYKKVREKFSNLAGWKLEITYTLLFNRVKISIGDEQYQRNCK